MVDALMVTSSFLPGRGGIESYLAALCSELAPRVAVFAPARRDGISMPEDLGYHTVGYAGSMLVPARRIADSVITNAQELGTDKVLFGTPWPLALLAPRLRRAGLRYAVIVHGAEVLVPAAIPIVRRRLASALSSADLLLPVSEFTATKLRALLGERGPRIEVLRARVDLERFRPDVDTSGIAARLGLPAGAQVVLSFGRLVKRKGMDRMIRAVHSLGSDRGVVAIVGGTGPDEARLRRLASRLGAPVIFAGRVPASDAPALYAVADVFCLPVVDRWFGLEVEGLGVVLLEAQACGTPCVTGRSGGTPEAVLDGETGFVVDGADVAALAGRIGWLLEHPDEAAAMGSAARNHVRDLFSGAETQPALLSWLES